MTDPVRRRIDRYFRRVWIPDESYLQRLMRRHGRRVESRSLTLSRFNRQGRPFVFYDDHLQLLRRSDCFVARRIWPGADWFYDTFLDPGLPSRGAAEPDPARLDRMLTAADDRRVRGAARACHAKPPAQPGLGPCHDMRTVFRPAGL
ncbi:hypothetical protein [Rhodovulum visakhapatnamense]|uniref:DUF5927 domain-containing protein n=1 Tax=Rhodovulum visakhapatnamense TaxID=364297 RepID=UPI003B21DF1C